MTTLTILDAKGETKTIETELSVYSIEGVIRSYELKLIENNRQSRRRELAIDLRIERQRIVGKLKKLGLRVQTNDQQYSSWGWDTDVERKDSFFEPQLGKPDRISFKDEATELRAVVALRGQTDLVFTEDIVESKSFGETKFSLVRSYTVTLPAQPEAE
jgi:hypothetical protein